MFPCTLLRLGFAPGLWVGLEMTSVPVGTSGRETTKVSWGSSRLSLEEDFVLRGPQPIGYDHSRALIHGMPKPSWLGLLPTNTPPFIPFHGVHVVDRHDELSGIPRVDGWMVEVVELRRLFVTRQ
jgi:hypothetical protein